jgi:hypothetical protein
METLELNFDSIDRMKTDFRLPACHFIKQNMQQTWEVLNQMLFMY